MAPCIITVFDLVGIRELASTGRGSSAMIAMHRNAVAKINSDLPLHDIGYVWNDSVMLLSYEVKSAQKRSKLLAELNGFKEWLQRVCATQLYAISVKGEAFPHDEMAAARFDHQIAEQPRAIVLKTSSWAMTNCFTIEKELGKYRADWYIDDRITKNVSLPPPFATEDVVLLPKNKRRRIHMFRGGLHPAS